MGEAIPIGYVEGRTMQCRAIQCSDSWPSVKLQNGCLEEIADWEETADDGPFLWNMDLFLSVLVVFGRLDTELVRSLRCL